MIYGYACVSTDGQSVDAQVRQLRAAGAGKVFREVASGAKTERAQLRCVLAELGAGDVLTVTLILGSEERQSLMEEDIPLSFGLPAPALKYAPCRVSRLQAVNDSFQAWASQADQNRECRVSTHSRRCRFRAREPAKTALKTHYLLPPLIRRL
jgi:hypothetical protein